MPPDLDKLTTWPNPLLPGGISWSVPQPISDCACPYCERMRGGAGATARTEDLSSRLEYLERQTGKDNYSLISAEGRIKKLEELVKVMATALGVNVDFLSDVSKGGA